MRMRQAALLLATFGLPTGVRIAGEPELTVYPSPDGKGRSRSG